MKTLDTNVLVRVLLGDDPVQTPIAEQAFLHAAAEDGVYVPDVVLVEIASVLGSGYKLDRRLVHERLHRLVRTAGVVVDDLDDVVRALDRFASAGDLGDHLLLSRAQRVSALPVLTFDRRFARLDGVDLLA